jgi:hypothetical protein
MSKATCYGCQNNIANQEGHMDPGGCLYTQTLGDKIDEALEYYQEFTEFEINGPPPMPDYHDNVGWHEGQYDGMVDAMMDELDLARTNLKELCEQAKGTEYENMAKDAYAVVLSNQQEVVCTCCGYAPCIIPGTGSQGIYYDHEKGKLMGTEDCEPGGEHILFAEKSQNIDKEKLPLISSDVEILSDDDEEKQGFPCPGFGSVKCDTMLPYGYHSQTCGSCPRKAFWNPIFNVND